MNRKKKLREYLEYWQVILNLQSWKLQVKLKDFHRTDWPQTGDITVDQKRKQAVVYISKRDTGKDKAIILHELIHLLLWEYDHFCERRLLKKDKKTYFLLLEKTVSDLENILLQKDK